MRAAGELLGRGQHGAGFSAARVLVGRDAQVMDWFTRLVQERAMTMIADRMASLLQR